MRTEPIKYQVFNEDWLLANNAQSLELLPPQSQTGKCQPEAVYNCSF